MDQSIARKISVRLRLANIPQNVNVVRCETEFERLCEVARCQRDANGEGEAKPEICGVEQELVVAEDISVEPAWSNDVVDGLKFTISILLILGVK
jgi:hypothetical protein